MNRSAFLCLILSLWCFAAEAADIIPVERDHRKWEQAKFGLTIALRPVLHLPGGEGPHPVAIIINSSAGAKDIFLHEWPKALNADGFAAVSLDTFTPRGIRSTTRDQSQISVFTMALDALAVARHLAGDPRLRADRMIVSGHSKGASTAVHLANAQFYERFHVRPVFAAGAVFSPDCFVQFPGSTTAFPIYALSGEKDDVTPPAYCLPLFARLNGNPHPAILEIIPGTWHSWSIDGPTVKYAPRPAKYQPRSLCHDGAVSDGNTLPPAQHPDRRSPVPGTLSQPLRGWYRQDLRRRQGKPAPGLQQGNRLAAEIRVFYRRDRRSVSNA